MARSINQIQLIGLAIFLIRHRHRTSFDRDPTLTFEIKIVQQLFFHLANRHSSCVFEQSIRQRALAVVDMGDDAEITYQSCHIFSCDCFLFVRSRPNRDIRRLVPASQI